MWSSSIDNPSALSSPIMIFRSDDSRSLNERSFVDAERGRGRGQNPSRPREDPIGTRIERTDTILVIGQHHGIFSCLLFGTSVFDRDYIRLHPNRVEYFRARTANHRPPKEKTRIRFSPIGRKKTSRVWGRHSCSKLWKQSRGSMGGGGIEREREIEPSQIRNIFDKFQR